MSWISVIVAALASYGFGAVWYMTLARPWMKAAGVAADETGKPVTDAGPMPYVIAIFCSLLVAGMMRHVFELSGIDTAGAGAVAGLGLGLFIAAPWIATNYAFADRPMKLTLIDGGYATLGSTLMGLILGIF
ncbi:DUF1761 domain-containing protein [Actibacterium ureilyticum]|uniref:DUF1761 domain-containing protein n=1 Tax=Actibacterium ureilyticum TaxID=1590614 RepID=UPI000BAACEF7|nr:DUF1761 domain-containing protein [Actibacterium ureilyticum]